MSIFKKKRFLIPCIVLLLIAVAGGVALKEKHRVKKFIKGNAFLYEQAKLVGRWTQKLRGGGSNKYVRHIDNKKSTWNLVFDASQSLGKYQRFWGDLGSESWKTGVLNGRARQLFQYIKDSNQRIGQGNFERNPFRYFRAHNLYSNGKPPWGEGLDIYNEEAGGGIRYDWELSKQVFDQLRSVGMKPIVEFGFMPDALASIPDRRQKWCKANISPPKDYGKWQQLVNETIRFFVNRYGAQEVSTWYFEVWNEPDLGWLFWIEDPKPSRNPYGHLAEYHKLYDLTVAAAKAALPSLRVGGPASAGGDIDLLMEHLFEDSNGQSRDYSPIDFTSSHSYGVIGYDHRLDFKQSLTSQIHWKLASSVEHDLPGIRNRMKQMPFILSETGPKYDEKRIRNKGRFVAAWYAKMVDSMFDLGANAGPEYQPREAVYWSAHQVVRKFDHFEGGIAASVKYNGHSSVYKLPIYNTIEALGYLSEERIALVTGSRFGETVHAIATKKEKESVEILLYHIDEDINERSDEGVNLDSVDVRVTIQNLPFERFELTHYAIDEMHSNSFSTWQRMGAPKEINKAERQKLLASQDLMLYQQVQLLDAGSKRRLQLDVTMQIQSVHLLRLTRK